jgi:hypothetical protein
LTVFPAWQDALMRLHVRGWEPDDIDAACEALREACSEGAHAGAQLASLTPSQVGRVIGQTLGEDEVAALLRVAELHGREDADGELLRAALYDLDAFAFAYAYAGDD